MTNKNTDVSVNCGCLGCFTSIAGFIGILWVLFHLSEIATFITG